MQMYLILLFVPITLSSISLERAFLTAMMSILISWLDEVNIFSAGIPFLLFKKHLYNEFPLV